MIVLIHRYPDPARVQFIAQKLRENWPVTTPPNTTTSFFVSSRTLIGCTDPLRRGVGAPHQSPLGLIASYLIYADVRTLRWLIVMTGRPRMVRLERENALDKIVCKIRDCFIRKSVSKFENGTEASLCFDRRKEPAATKAVVPLKTLGAMLLTFTTYNPDRFPPGSQEDVLAKMFDGSKHTVNTLHSPTKLVDYLVERGSMAKEVVFTEELLQYEVDGSARGLQKSVAAWTKVLNAWRLHPERNMLLKLLTPGWGKRKPPPPHREVIYNHEEVREALFTNPQWIHLRWMWRD